MRSKALPHIILAVVLALAAGVLTIRWLGSHRGPAEAPKQKPEVPKVEVVVAARPVAKGAKLDETMLKLKAYEAEGAPVGAERVVAEVVGRVTGRDISQDDPITPDKLLPRGVTAAGLATAVEAGRRAVTVKGSKVLGAGGLITPGSRVDVVATFQVPGKNDTKVGKMILEDIPVLTTGTETETRLGKDGREELANTDLFTLLVTPSEAERLALAADQGSLHFALRRTGDAQPVATPGTELGAMAGLSPAKTEGVPAAPPVYVYQAVRGSAPLAVGQGGGGQGAEAGAAGQDGGKQGGEEAMSDGNSLFSVNMNTSMASKSSYQPGKSAGNAPDPMAKEQSQGSEQIKVHQVTIDCPTCPPASQEARP